MCQIKYNQNKQKHEMHQNANKKAQIIFDSIYTPLEELDKGCKKKKHKKNLIILISMKLKLLEIKTGNSWWYKKCLKKVSKITK